jgi:PST family polysaccharide transporter
MTAAGKRDWRARVGWSVGGQVGIALIQVAVSIFLSRLAGPGAYGHFAIVLLTFTIASLVGDACVQALVLTSRGSDPEQSTHLFRFGNRFGLLRASPVLVAALGAALASGGDLIKLYEVALLVPAVAATIVSQVPRGLAIARGDMRNLALSDVSSSVLASGCALAAQAVGTSAGARGLIVLLVASPVVRAVYPIMSAWPTIHSPTSAGTPSPEASNTRRALYLSSLTTFAGRNLDNIAVGAFLGVQPLGFYARSYSLVSYPLQHVQLAIGPLGLVRIRASDREPMEAVGQRTHRLAPPLALAIIAASFLAPWALGYVLGDAWRPALPLISAMVGATYYQLLLMPVSWAAQVAHQGSLVRRMGMLSLVPLAAVGISSALRSFDALPMAFLIAAGPLQFALASRLLTEHGDEALSKSLRTTRRWGVLVTAAAALSIAGWQHWF